MDALQLTKQFQRCQRNWDLEREVPRSTVEWLVDVAYSSPTKQNLNSFEIVCITDRNLIHECTNIAVSTQGFSQELTDDIESGRRVQNPQVDANILFVYFISFEDHNSDKRRFRDFGPVLEKSRYAQNAALECGISAGALGVAAHSIGLKTGFCKCFQHNLVPERVYQPYNLDPRNIEFMLGVGYPLYDKHNLHTDGSNKNRSFTKVRSRKIII